MNVTEFVARTPLSWLNNFKVVPRVQGPGKAILKPDETNMIQNADYYRVGNLPITCPVTYSYQRNPVLTRIERFVMGIERFDWDDFKIQKKSSYSDFGLLKSFYIKSKHTTHGPLAYEVKVTTLHSSK